MSKSITSVAQDGVLIAADGPAAPASSSAAGSINMLRQPAVPVIVRAEVLPAGTAEHKDGTTIVLAPNTREDY